LPTGSCTLHEKRALRSPRSLLLVTYRIGNQQPATNNGNAISDYFRGADYHFRARLSAQKSAAGSARLRNVDLDACADVANTSLI
jgi:hypothetical protein